MRLSRYVGILRWFLDSAAARSALVVSPGRMGKAGTVNKRNPKVSDSGSVVLCTELGCSTHKVTLSLDSRSSHPRECSEQRRGTGPGYAASSSASSAAQADAYVDRWSG